MQRVDSTASNLSEQDGGKPVKVRDYHYSKSRVLSVINWLHVFQIYLPFVGFTAFAVLAYQLLLTLYHLRFDLSAFWTREVPTVQLHKVEIFELGWQSMLLVALIILFLKRREKSVYLVDFSCWQPPEDWRLSPEEILEAMRLQGCYTQDSLDFMTRMLERSGCGPRTAWPPAILACLKDPNHKLHTGTEEAREESRIVMRDCVGALLKSTGYSAKDIDILIVNCSLFSPTPSLCAMIINDFGMRQDILSYNLSGMGCSAGVISIDLAKRLMLGRPNSRAIIVSTENLTQALYLGNDRAFLLQNILFRCGGAAVLMSNCWVDGFKARFKLLTTVRTHYVSDESVGCVYDTEDPLGIHGVRLSKDIVKVAGRAMERNFTALGPHVLSYTEQIKVVISMIGKYVGKATGLFKISPYMPNFKRGIHHFCIHAGGRGVIDGVEKNLSLDPEHVIASRYALYTYGNTSSSSIWYEMDFIRKHLNLQRGQRVLQVAFGSGFKCNSAVWLCVNSKDYIGTESNWEPPEDLEAVTQESKKTK